MSQKPPRKSDEFKKAMYYTMTKKKPKTFSEKMAKLRQPFLSNEDCSNSQTLLGISAIKKEPIQHKHDDAKENLNTLINDNKLGFKQNYLEIRTPVSQTHNANSTLGTNYSAIEKEHSHTWHAREEKEKALETTNYTKVFKQDDSKYSQERHILLKEELKKDSLKCSGAMPNDSEISEISGYYSEESEHKINTSLDTSVENLSYQLKPLKNSTFIQEEIIKYGLHSETLDKEESKEQLVCEENRKLKAKIIEMELCKQIETKDKVMSQLLDIAKSAGFPNLKHLCNKECERGIDGICKKLKHDQKLQEEYGGLLQYIWSTIKYPFTSLPPVEEEKDGKLGNSIIKLQEVKENIKQDCIKDIESGKFLNNSKVEIKNVTENTISDCPCAGNTETVGALIENGNENIKTKILEDHVNNKDVEVLNTQQGSEPSSTLEEEQEQKLNKDENKRPRRSLLYFFQKK